MVQTRLREIREAQGLTITALARLSGVSRQSIYTIEAGRGCKTTLQTLKRLAVALSVPLSDLLTEPP